MIVWLPNVVWVDSANWRYLRVARPRALTETVSGSVPSFVEKEKRRNLLLTKQIAQRGEGGIRREEGYHD